MHACAKATGAHLILPVDRRRRHVGYFGASLLHFIFFSPEYNDFEPNSS